MGFHWHPKPPYQYPDLILAAGGDGTLNQVVNGVLTGRETEIKLPVIGLIPMGSGNDFARTAGLKADAKQLICLWLPGLSQKRSMWAK
jgi:diacylglycerol kinase (ATP)